MSESNSEIYAEHGDQIAECLLRLYQNDQDSPIVHDMLNSVHEQVYDWHEHGGGVLIQQDDPYFHKNFEDTLALFADLGSKSLDRGDRLSDPALQLTADSVEEVGRDELIDWLESSYQRYGYGQYFEEQPFMSMVQWANQEMDIESPPSFLEQVLNAYNKERTITCVSTDRQIYNNAVDLKQGLEKQCTKEKEIETNE